MGLRVAKWRYFSRLLACIDLWRVSSSVLASLSSLRQDMMSSDIAERFGFYVFFSQCQNYRWTFINGRKKNVSDQLGQRLFVLFAHRRQSIQFQIRSQKALSFGRWIKASAAKHYEAQVNPRCKLLTKSSQTSIRCKACRQALSFRVNKWRLDLAH